VKPVSVLISVVALIVLTILWSSLYVVDQTRRVLVFQLGEVVAVRNQPGLYFKIPLIQNVRSFDARIMTLEQTEPERYITAEKKPVLVDYFVKWRIDDVRKFYISNRGDAEMAAQTRLVQTINDELRAQFAKRTVHDAVSGEREKIVTDMREKADRDARSIGVQVVDVRIKRVELTPEVSDSVYRRMEAERKRVANELRSTGAGEAEKIKADADKQREIIIAEAFREAQRVKGSGDAKSAAIYASGYGQDPEFYAFYRSLDSYRQIFRTRSDLMVLDPTSDYMRYFKSPARPK
jgi:modulator of FtsH protease HflC